MYDIDYCILLVDNGYNVYANIDTGSDCDENSCEGGSNYITEYDHKHLNAYSYPEVSLIEDDDKCKE